MFQVMWNYSIHWYMMLLKQDYGLKETSPGKNICDQAPARQFCGSVELYL